MAPSVLAPVVIVTLVVVVVGGLPARTAAQMSLPDCEAMAQPSSLP
jgi:hypothetical protein